MISGGVEFPPHAAARSTSAVAGIHRLGRRRGPRNIHQQMKLNPTAAWIGTLPLASRVVTVNTMSLPVVPGTTCAGENAHAARTGRPVQLKLIALSKLVCCGIALIVYAAAAPPATVAVLGVATSVKSASGPTSMRVSNV